MAYYQIYALNAASRIAGNSIDMVCSSDLEACRIAGHMLSNGACAEVWSGFRYVGVISVPGLKMIEVSGHRGSESRNQALPQVTLLAEVSTPSWGRPDLFTETGLAA